MMRVWPWELPSAWPRRYCSRPYTRWPRRANWSAVAAPMPPKAPELNPVENLWQFIRDNWLSNRIFQSYDDILDHACAAWNRIVDQPWRIMTIGMRDCVHGF